MRKRGCVAGDRLWKEDVEDGASRGRVYTRVGFLSIAAIVTDRIVPHLAFAFWDVEVLVL
jgi:hypothetical protein